MTLTIMTFIKYTDSIMAFITALSINDSEYKVMLFCYDMMCWIFYWFAECRYAKCCSDEGRGANQTANSFFKRVYSSL
jgi:hypothetical protein